MTRARWFYVACLPIVWATICAVSFPEPRNGYLGLEYAACWLLGSMPGVWVFFLDLHLPQGWGPIHEFLSVLLAGVLVMVALGLVLDKLRCPLTAYLIVWLASASALMLYELFSQKQLMSKNGLFYAYVLAIFNFSIFSTAVAMIAMIGTWRVVQAYRRRRQALPMAQ